MLKNSKKGFTIIEVVIVLVIGAVIMLMVFTVVPSLQRSQRDARRQNDARRFLTAAEQWATSHGGAYPSNIAQMTDVRTNYIQDAFADPSTGDYTFAFGTGTPARGTLRFATSASCTNNVMTTAADELRRVAVGVFQENGTSYCVNN